MTPCPFCGGRKVCALDRHRGGGASRHLPEKGDLSGRVMTPKVSRSTRRGVGVPRTAVVGLALGAVLMFAPYCIPDTPASPKAAVTRSDANHGATERVQLIERPSRTLSAERIDHVTDPGRVSPPSSPRLACIRRYESGGNYAAVSRSGKYRGAYQFDARTWNAAAKSSPHTDYVGADPARAPHEIQDSLAGHLYRQRGLQPWSQKVRRYCR